jgi:hypothetical protein
MTIATVTEQHLVTLNIPFEMLVQAAQSLSTIQKVELIKRLDLPIASLSPSRQQLLTELALLRQQGAFQATTSLQDKFANPKADQIKDEQLLDDIRTAATAWKTELNEFYSRTN